MAFKFVAVFCSLLAISNAGVITPITTYHNVAIANPAVDAVASTHQNVVRSFGGTVSTYSKAVDTPYSSVRKEDTRISNNVYTPALAKTVTYAAPAVTKTVAVASVPTAAVYTHSAPVYAQASAPVVYSHVAPAVSKTITYTAAPAPTVTKTVLAPTSGLYTHAVPTVAKSVSFNHGSDATTYTHEAPGVSGYGSSQIIRYSPAEMVSHMSFDGFGTHWGF